ncbi:MAG: sigma-54 dependent transcriptional regulator [Candidatus Eisenbacteria bacterium]|uniref:Sigma-54 dependent transcriptional regulator n=1 Tax=Eiseniibacteriota bacterium TaxID=2212470 RepID=A0A948S1N1_UNCEI|nr:sigma-54 dependent transcriptional regulator [Candidatus Eisenbacteria bacterium]MBU1950933.1 sigma-54 dependent transcriptional regulator [Candidatus Eisenbacteria bacterium]MBU2692194.1 sigma-54 dependent transcriptional regulator [Candidatus Eisenbacteria bacterium]
MSDVANPTNLQYNFLVVDDEESIRVSLTEALRDEHSTVWSAIGGVEAFKILEEREIDLILLDQKLRATGEDGLELLQKFKEAHPEVIIIIMTAFGRFDDAVEATKAGCFQYLAKPLDIHQLRLIIKNALSTAALRKEVEYLRRQQSLTHDMGAIFGPSAKIHDVLENVRKVARSSTATVLIRGETGVGKELIARKVHEFSPVNEGPFIDINCSTLPEHLLESELFGHEKGAFTDAQQTKMGLLELADNGTLFLDEIAEMSPKLQAKLLRVLETRTFRRLGGTADIRVSTRFLAATNKDLFREVEDGNFREDLYYRLTVVPIYIPPLRERREDIPVLIKTFLEAYNRELGKNVRGFTDMSLRRLMDYNWPGNVRELRNVMERLVLMCDIQEIGIDELPRNIVENERGPKTATPEENLFSKERVPNLKEVEKIAICHAIKFANGNKTKAADLLGISRQTLRTKLREYELEDIPEETF